MKWKGFGYDFNNNIVYELEKGKGYVKEYDFFGNIIFERKIFKWNEKWKRERI